MTSNDHLSVSRNDIQLLRGLCVVAVVAFHLFPDVVTRGYLGVDIFFAISGYVITLSILNRKKDGTFDTLRFVKDRVTRLYPVLIAVVFSTYLFSFIFSTPGSLKVVGQSSFASVLMANNLLLSFQEFDYFDLLGEGNPLYPTWSLGVEFQFYAFFAFIIYFFQTIRKTFFLLLAAIFFISTAKYSLDFDFFGVLDRAWELIAGVFTALLVGSRVGLISNNKIVWLYRLALVFLVMTLFSSANFFSNSLARISSVGLSCVLIYIGHFLRFNNRASFPPLVFVGTISYSVYLWHQPVIWGLSHFGDEIVGLSIVVTLLLSSITYLVLERNHKAIFSKLSKISVIFFLISFLILLAGVLGHFNGGFPYRGQEYAQLKQSSGYGLHCNGLLSFDSQCASDPLPSSAIVGNSFAMHHALALGDLLPGGIVQLTQDSCELLLGFKGEPITPDCEGFGTRAVRGITDIASVDTVFLGSPFRELLEPAKREAFTRLLGRLSEYKIVLLVPPPSADFDVGKCFLVNRLVSGKTGSCDFPKPGIHSTLVSHLNHISQSYSNVVLWDYSGRLCNADQVCSGSLEGVPFYVDGLHLTVPGSRYVLKGMDLHLKRTQNDES